MMTEAERAEAARRFEATLKEGDPASASALLHTTMVLDRVLRENRQLAENLAATQTRASELMAIAQAAAWYLRSLDDVVVARSVSRPAAREQLREALKKIWPEFDRP